MNHYYYIQISFIFIFNNANVFGGLFDMPSHYVTKYRKHSPNPTTPEAQDFWIKAFGSPYRGSSRSDTQKEMTHLYKAAGAEEERRSLPMHALKKDYSLEKRAISAPYAGGAGSSNIKTREKDNEAKTLADSRKLLSTQIANKERIKIAKQNSVRLNNGNDRAMHTLKDFKGEKIKIETTITEVKHFTQGFIQFMIQNNLLILKGTDCYKPDLVNNFIVGTAKRNEFLKLLLENGVSPNGNLYANAVDNMIMVNELNREESIKSILAFWMMGTVLINAVLSLEEAGANLTKLGEECANLLDKAIEFDIFLGNAKDENNKELKTLRVGISTMVKNGYTPSAIAAAHRVPAADHLQQQQGIMPANGGMPINNYAAYQHMPFPHHQPIFFSPPQQYAAGGSNQGMLFNNGMLPPIYNFANAPAAPMLVNNNHNQQQSANMNNFVNNNFGAFHSPLMNNNYNNVASHHRAVSHGATRLGPTVPRQDQPVRAQHHVLPERISAAAPPELAKWAAAHQDK